MEALVVGGAVGAGPVVVGGAVVGFEVEVPAVVEEFVVVGADQCEVGEGGGALVAPVGEVVGVEVAGAVAAGEHAVVVAFDQLAAEPVGDGAGGGADVDR